jgi:quinol monooxygenase YgiN
MAGKLREGAMRTLSWMLIGIIMLAASAQPAAAQSPSIPPIYVVTYFDAVPTESETINLLHQFGAATRKEDGNLECTVLDEIGRSGRFAIVEAWRDKAALDAHDAAMKALGSKLQPLIIAPFSTRQYAPLSAARSSADPKLGTAMYVLTHVDVFPPGKDDAAAMIKTLSEASQNDKGALRFDALVWDGHPNHFQLIEAWTDHLAREAHAAAEHTRAFRAKLTPLEGALYDERLYEVVR